MGKLTCHIQTVHHFFLLMTLSINLKMTVGDNCLDAANPSPARRKGLGNYCPNPDSQVHVSLTYINFCFSDGDECCSLNFDTKGGFPNLDLPLSHIWYASWTIQVCDIWKAKRPGIHDYISVVLHGTFLPRWIKEQSGYWRVTWNIVIYAYKVVKVFPEYYDSI